MSGGLRFRRNVASEAEIAAHLRDCDQAFVPPLSARVDIAAYAHKIAARATRFEAWDRALIGLLAAYCNDQERRTAFITSVSVVHEWQRQGIAARLLARCVGYAKAQGFRDVELQVDADNAAAIELYRKRSFTIDRANGREVFMRLDLAGAAR